MHVHYTHSPGLYLRFRHHAPLAAPRCQNFTLDHIDPVIHPAGAGSASSQRASKPPWQPSTNWTPNARLSPTTGSSAWKAHYEVELAQARLRTGRSRQPPGGGRTGTPVGAGQALAGPERIVGRRQEFQASQSAPSAAVDQAAIRRLAEDLPALWQAETTTQEDRKRLLRCLIRDVTLDSLSQPGFSQIHVHWHTGTTTTLRIPRPGLLRALSRLPCHRTRAAMAQSTRRLHCRLLNQENFLTATGLPWTRNRVYAVRRKHQIPPLVLSITRFPKPCGDGSSRPNSPLNTSASPLL